MPSVDINLEDILEEVRCECGETLQWERARRPGGRREEGIIEVTPCECEYKKGEENGYKRGYEEGEKSGIDEGYEAGYEEGRESVSTRITPPKSCLLTNL